MTQVPFSIFFSKKTRTLMPLTQLIGRIASTAIAVLPASQQYRAMQRQKILGLQETGSQLKNNFACGSEDSTGLLGPKPSFN